MASMKQRLSLSIDADTAAWLTRQAAQAGDNLSHYVEEHFRRARLADAVAAEARYGRAHGRDDYDQAERDALDAEINPGSAA